MWLFRLNQNMATWNMDSIQDAMWLDNRVSHTRNLRIFSECTTCQWCFLVFDFNISTIHCTNWPPWEIFPKDVHSAASIDCTTNGRPALRLVILWYLNWHFCSVWLIRWALIVSRMAVDFVQQQTQSCFQKDAIKRLKAYEHCSNAPRWTKFNWDS